MTKTAATYLRAKLQRLKKLTTIDRTFAPHPAPRSYA
jgi:hypothetical protein